MITGEIHISTTWNASTSFIPFDIGMVNAHDVAYGGTANRGRYATTAYVNGVWENQIYEDDFKDYLVSAGALGQPNQYGDGTEQAAGLSGLEGRGNAFRPGTVIEVTVRKLKALKTSPDRSGIQVNRRMLNGNKLIFKYLAQGELVRPR